MDGAPAWREYSQAAAENHAFRGVCGKQKSRYGRLPELINWAARRWKPSSQVNATVLRIPQQQAGDGGHDGGEGEAVCAVRAGGRLVVKRHCFHCAAHRGTPTTARVFYVNRASAREINHGTEVTDVTFRTVINPTFLSARKTAMPEYG